jgi:CMP-N-acetylneuraminic acid synthetase
MKTISAVINARLQSSRTPQKLIRPFAGKTLIEIALEKLNDMDFFEHRFLAVAEEPFKEICKKFPNVELIERSPDAVKPGFHPQKIIYQHYLRIPSDYIFWINPCQPFLKIETIRRAYEYVNETDYNSYTAVCSFRDWVFDSSGQCIMNTDPEVISTNHTNEFFKMAHSFHVYNKKHFAYTGLIWSMKPNDPHLISVNKEETYDVDYPIDFQVAETIYESSQKIVNIE